MKEFLMTREAEIFVPGRIVETLFLPLLSRLLRIYYFKSLTRNILCQSFHDLIGAFRDMPICLFQTPIERLRGIWIP
jgi:hypothetical protein